MTLDLHRHAVLEASAGTGKTHSIGALVLRLLKEEGVTLDRMLIVTFTDKATGELRSRLRAGLEKEAAAAQDTQLAEVLRRAVDNFDQSWIFTLHGFCRRILQEFPLEQGQDVNSQLVHDRELLVTCLRELQRRTWRQEYGPRLREVLQISCYDREHAAAWEEQVCYLAEKLRPDSEHRMAPRAIPDWPHMLGELDRDLRTALPRWRDLVRQYDQVESKFVRHLDRVRSWLFQARPEAQPVLSFYDLICLLGPRGDFAKSGFLLPNMSMDRPLTGLGSPDALIAELYTSLERMRRRAADWPSFRWQLALRTVTQLQAALENYKRQHGLWSFEDMLRRVDDALDPAKNPRADYLAATLRQRFLYGIVDEFQDTDPVQWRILQRIFLAPAAACGLAHDTKRSLLFLVGDPKQAIFGFRGADLPTYLHATRAMLDQHQAQDFPLVVNWRSSPELLTGLNRLFHDGQWFPEDSGIRYLPAQPAGESERPSKLIMDRTGRPALNAVDWRQDQFLAKLRRNHAQFIVHEIRRLLSTDEPTLVSINRAEPRALNAGDVCVLVFRRNEARPLIGFLREAGIPFSFYKQAALWKSEEAVHLRIVLEALGQPEHRPAFRKALLTRFFRIAPQELASHDELPSRHPARQLFDQWLDLAARRQWSALFQSMLEDTGLLFVESSDGDRSRANFRHLTGQLIQQAYRHNLDLLSLADWCRRQENMGVVDEDLQPKETERPRVQIMTIHASKGLEFPIVFLAGGWTQTQADKVLAYRTETDELIYDLANASPTGPAKNSAERGRLDEERRLLYVALTRAMFKLYVPYTLADGKSLRKKGPIVNLLAPALIRSHIDQCDPASAAIVPPGWSPGFSRSATEAPLDPTPSKPTAWTIAGPLLPALDIDLTRRGMVVRSFSSLHRANQLRTAEASSFAAVPPRAEDEDFTAATDTDEQRDPLRGAVFGEIVHGVLENIDFEAVGQASAPALLLAQGSPAEKVLAEQIDQYLPQIPTQLTEKELRVLCRQRVAELVWHALHMPLPELGPLWQIPRQDRLQELAFHYPEREPHSTHAARHEEVFLTGFIDLVVRRQGRYYLLDWKTNALPGYGLEELAKAMNDGDYHLQYRLYLQALARWLRRNLGDRFDANRDLGGVYYLFLRGMTGQNATDGVFYHRPTAEDLQLERVLSHK